MARTARKNRVPALLLLAALVASFLIGRFSFSLQTSAVEPVDVEVNETTRARAPDYKFISPLLQCEAFNPPAVKTIWNAELAAERATEAAKAAGEADVVSVYFRDLNNGPWFGINEQQAFLPASLLKVPLLMAYLRAADSDPRVLDMTITYDDPSLEGTQNFVYEPPMEAGRQYTVRELLERLIRGSDNPAMALLTSDELLRLDVLEEVYKDLGIGSPADIPNYQINAITYSRFLRILYNATYVSREMSEYSLELLSQSGFQQGLRAGVPANIVIAHKFGERFMERTGERQLHDCGIIYAPDRPYLLCLMTQGKDFQKLSKVIADVSRQVYHAVTERGVPD